MQLNSVEEKIESLLDYILVYSETSVNNVLVPTILACIFESASLVPDAYYLTSHYIRNYTHISRF